VDYNALFERILGQVDQAAYMPLADVVDPAQQAAMGEIETQLRDPSIPAHVTESLIHGSHQDGRIDRVHMLSALHVLAALIRLDDLSEAQALVKQVRGAFKSALVADLNQMIAQDPDLALLREETDPC
jgi:hypothetical protein